VAWACAGDCKNTGAVDVADLVTSVNIALGQADLATCPAVDANSDQHVSVNELIAAVNNALYGCGGAGAASFQ
jgi:hypothetical protein